MLKRFLRVICVSLVLFLLAGCGKEQPVIPVELTLSNNQEMFVIDFFDIRDLVVEITFSDGSKAYQALETSMILESDVAKLATIGAHQITITYLGLTRTFTINLVYDDLTQKLRSIYDLALTAQATTLTYEAWLLSIRGEDGIDGREVELRVHEDYIQWRYIGDSNWTNLIALQSLIGPKGAPGMEVELRLLDDHIQWKYQEDSTWINLIPLSFLMGATGDDGIDGISIRSVSINAQGELIVELSDGSIINAGLLITSELSYQLIFRFDRRGPIYEYLRVHDEEIINEPIYPVRAGYVFGGWYLNEEKVEFPFVFSHDEDIELIAKWTQNPFLFTITEETVKITGYDDILPQRLIIPDEIDGYPVTKIGTHAFYNQELVRYLTIGKNVEIIEDYAFASTQIRYVTFAKDSALQKIEAWSFANNSRLLSVTFNEHMHLKSIEDFAFSNTPLMHTINLPEGLKTIKTYAFSNSGVETWQIPDTVETIGIRAFRYNTKAIRIEINASSQLEKIHSEAFEACDLLEYIYLPSSITQMGAYVFKDNPRLVIYTEALSEIEDIWNQDWNVTNNPVIWGVLGQGRYQDIDYVINGDDQLIITKSRSAYLPDVIDQRTVTIIGQSAFRHTTIEYFTLPDSITHIKKWAFANTNGLSRFVISPLSQLISIQSEAFYLSGINSIALSKRVTDIAKDAFKSSFYLTIYTEHDHMPLAWHSTFNPDLLDIVWSIKGYGQTDAVDYVINLDDEIVIIGQIEGQRSLFIPDKIGERPVVEIATRAIKGNTLNAIVIPITVERIGMYGIYREAHIEVFTAHPSKPAGWDEQFHLFGANITYGIKSYGTDDAIHYIITAANNLIVIGADTALTEIKLPHTIQGYKVEKIADFAFMYYPNLEKVIIANTISDLGKSTFKNTLTLKEVIFEQDTSLNVLDEAVFLNTGLLEITIPKEITQIKSAAFSSTKALARVYFEAQSQLETIGSYAFYESVLTSIVIPQSVYLIDYYAFGNIAELMDVTFAANSNLSIIKTGVFANSGLVSIIIPKSVITIEESVFESASNLENVLFEEGAMINSIGALSFYSLPKLEKIIVPITVDTMGFNVFGDAPQLTIYLRVAVRPSGWNIEWQLGCTVVWSYLGD